MSDIKTILASLQKYVQNSEKLAIPLLTSKLSKLAELYPQDATIMGISKVLTKVQSKNQFTITRGELKNMYRQLYARNTKFADYFGEELGSLDGPAVPKLYEKHEEPIKDIYSAGGNSVMAALLTGELDKSDPETLFSKDDAQKALASVNEILESWSARASKLEISTGDKSAIIIKANYDTPKGIVSFLVPVEIKSGIVIKPTAFVGNAGAKEINHTNIKNYLTASIDAKLPEVNRPGSKDIELPKAEQFDSFAAKFESPFGVATFKFGSDKVNLGRDIIVRTLAGFGIDYPQMNIVDTKDNAIVYGVSVGGKVSFKVPVKLANNKVLAPDFMICNGSVMAFTKANITSLFAKNESDYKVLASTSPAYGLKVNELLEVIREAALEHNYTKAEDALNVLQQTGGEKAYKQALQEYMSGLSIQKTEESTIKCSMIVKSSVSQYPTCGHTGLPLHKVFQDEHGNCHPLYRKDMPNQFESAIFNNSKIFG